MKKYLLAGTALAGAVAFGGQAFAQAQPVTLTLSGNVDFQAGVATEEEDDARDRDYDFLTDAEITFNFDGVADNGLEYGGEIELDGVTADEGANVDEVWAYIAGTWGEVRLGDKEGPVGNFSIAAPVAGDGIWDGGFGDYVTGGTPSVSGFDQDLGDVTTISYLTPNFNGFQAGIGFAPNDQTGANGEDDLTDLTTSGGESLTVSEAAVGDLNGDGDATDSFTVSSDSSSSGRPEHENFISFGGAYGGDFGATSIQISGGIGYAEYVGESADDDDRLNANVGLNVGFGGFTVGGSWVSLLEAAEGIEDQHDFSFGVGYGMGAWNVALSGVYTMTDLEGGGEDEGITFGAGADYAIAPGLSVYADVVYFDAEFENEADNDGVVGLAGVDVNF